jgi:hypothetical protein
MREMWRSQREGLEREEEAEERAEGRSGPVMTKAEMRAPEES